MIGHGTASRLVERLQDRRWSSLHAHLAAGREGPTKIPPMLERYPGFAEFIAQRRDAAAFPRLRRAESIGRPPGNDGFIARLETLTGRTLRPGKRGANHHGNPATVIRVV